MARVVDPVCDMEFDDSAAADQSVWHNRTFYFCHPVCKKIFDAQPWRFVYKGNPNIKDGRPKILKLEFTRDDFDPAA